MLFDEIVERFDELQLSKTPLSDIAHEKGFSTVSIVEEDELFRAEKKEDENVLIISIKSHDHDRTFQIRPSTYHNYLYCFDGERVIQYKSYMYEDT